MRPSHFLAWLGLAGKHPPLSEDMISEETLTRYKEPVSKWRGIQLTVCDGVGGGEVVAVVCFLKSRNTDWLKRMVVRMWGAQEKRHIQDKTILGTAIDSPFIPLICQLLILPLSPHTSYLSLHKVFLGRKGWKGEGWRESNTHKWWMEAKGLTKSRDISWRNVDQKAQGDLSDHGRV